MTITSSAISYREAMDLTGVHTEATSGPWRIELREQGLHDQTPDYWTITPVTPLSQIPIAHIFCDGDY